MYPIATSPSRGYSDYQRIVNYDEQPFWTPNIGTTNVAQGSPVHDVSRFAYLGGFMAESFDRSIVTVTWTSDILGQIPVATRVFILAAGIGNVAQLGLVNLGPYVAIGVNGFGGGNYRFRASVFGTNRVYSLPLMPVNAVIINQQNQAVAANAVATIYPTDYYAGPARIRTTATQTYRWDLFTLDAAGTWDVIDQRVGLGANVISSELIITPAGAWQLQVTNTSGVAGNYWAVVTPSATGAS